MRPPADHGRTWALVSLAVVSIAGWTLVHGCAATIPEDRYGVASLQIEGAEHLHEDTLAICLATQQRPRFTLGVLPTCGEPPFDRTSNLQLWRWWWTDWPLFDREIFERDLARIERWYRARGYYDAHVLSSRVVPASAMAADRIEPGPGTCSREDDDEGCTVDITLRVEEGDPVLVGTVAMNGAPADLSGELWEVVQLEPGEPFDEFRYDRSKEAIKRILEDASYARADVSGEVQIDREGRRAAVSFEIAPGPRCVFGTVDVVGNEDLGVAPIVGTALIDRGQPYSRQALEDAQAAIYSLGAFSSVAIDPYLAGDAGDNIIPVTIRVVPGRLERLRFGIGVQSGKFEFSDTTVGADVPQWDIHLLGRYEHRNLFGGLRRFTVEERLRYTFTEPPLNLTNRCFDKQSTFLGTLGDVECLGNDLRMELRQPAFAEPRTTLVASARSEIGLEPYSARWFRHDVQARVGPERMFFGRRLKTSVQIAANLYLVDDASVREGAVASSDYFVPFLQQFVGLDLRDDARSAHRGAYFSVGAQEAAFFSWDYFRLTAEARGYLPLPLDMVLAGRVALGSMFVLRSDGGLDAASQELGPERFRLRGGGPSSNRGYLPAQLGDSFEGGLRRWEAAMELRIALLPETFGLVIFGDAADVHRGDTFRFSYLHLSVGGGFRLYLLGLPVRFDIGWQVPEAQVLGADDSVELGGLRAGEPVQRSRVQLCAFGGCLFDFAGAAHLSIGEAF